MTQPEPMWLAPRSCQPKIRVFTDLRGYNKIRLKTANFTFAQDQFAAMTVGDIEGYGEAKTGAGIVLIAGLIWQDLQEGYARQIPGRS